MAGATVGILEHFQRLFDFRGREDRASFWPYAALVYGIMMVASSAAIIPTMQSAMKTATIATPRSGTSPFPEMQFFFNVILVMTIVAVILYAAAVVRRLHDAGLRGFWGLMPLPFLFFGMIRMRWFMASFPSADP